MTWAIQYRLEPDFRIQQRLSPEAFDSVPRCLRCQKPLKDSHHPVTVNYNDHLFIDGHWPHAWPVTQRAYVQIGFLGSDCHMRMKALGPHPAYGPMKVTV